MLYLLFLSSRGPATVKVWAKSDRQQLRCQPRKIVFCCAQYFPKKRFFRTKSGQNELPRRSACVPITPTGTCVIIYRVPVTYTSHAHCTIFFKFSNRNVGCEPILFGRYKKKGVAHAPVISFPEPLYPKKHRNTYLLQILR